MFKTPYFCAESTKFACLELMTLLFSLQHDPLSQVLDMLRLRSTNVMLSTLQTQEKIEFRESAPCIYVQQHGEVNLYQNGAVFPIRVYEGDVALLIHGGKHSIVDDQPHRGQNKKTSVLRGQFTFDGAYCEHLLSGLPQVIILRRPAIDTPYWVDIASSFLIDEVKDGKAGATAMVSRLIDLLFIRTLRTWASESEGGYGWLSGAVDQRISKVLAAIHLEPERDWSIRELSNLCALSRSAFTSRFQKVVGSSPIAYLNAWRLDRASELLRGGGLSVGTAALRLGYKSEAAFSRAFRKRHGSSPKDWSMSRSSNM